MLIIGYVTYLYKNNVRNKEKEFDQMKLDLERSEERSKERDTKLEDKQSEMRERLVRLESTSVTREDLENLFDSKLGSMENRIMDTLRSLINRN